MAKNLMPEVARLLGVEIGEEFEVCLLDGSMSDYGPFVFSETQIEDKHGMVADYKLHKLINGEFAIVKNQNNPTPYKPIPGDRYWYVNNDDWEATGISTYCGDIFDLMAVATGNCFRTEREAMDARGGVLKRLGGEG